VTPFHLRYTLTRRQRLATELYPWLPAIAGALGFCLGAAFLSLAVSRWFLLLLLIPVVAYHGLFAFFCEIVFRAARPVEVVVDESELEVLTNGERWRCDLDGIIQVFRSEDATTWTVLHIDGLVLTVPASAISGEQLDYLKSFARRAAAHRAEVGN
jgi:hypothetical protein